MKTHFLFLSDKMLRKVASCPLFLALYTKGFVNTDDITSPE